MSSDRAGRLPALRLPALLLLLGLALLAAPVWALSDAEVEAEVLRITGDLRCPTCQGISVRDSAAAFSRQITEKVRRMLREGQSEADIKAYFVSRYGEWILRAPKKEGLGLVLWILPGLVVVLAGAGMVYRVHRAGRQRSGEDETRTLPILSEGDRARIERDLKRFEDDDLA